MRKFIVSLFVAAALCFSGCDNPISSVGLTANPDGTFGVDVTFKNGATINFPNISPGQLASLQKQYRIRNSMIVMRSANACAPAMVTSMATEIRAPSIARRVYRSFAGNCACDAPATILPTPDTPAPADPIVWGPAPVESRRAEAPSLESRVNALESKMDKILALVEQIKK